MPLENIVRNRIHQVRTVLLLLLASLGALAGAQQKPVHWSATFEPSDMRAGEVGYIVLQAKIDAPWHIYSLKDTADATPTTVTVGKGVFEANGAVQVSQPIIKYDENFQANTSIHEGEATFHIPVKISATATGSPVATVDVRFQACNASNCMRPVTETVKVPLTIAAGAARADHAKLPELAPPPLKPVHWSATFEPSDTRVGEVGYMVVHATIDPTWHIYSLKDTADATPTSFALLPGSEFALAGPVQVTAPIVRFDDGFQANTALHEKEATFRIPVKVLSPPKDGIARIAVKFQACATSCMRPATETVTANMTPAVGAARADRATPPPLTAMVGEKPSTPAATSTDDFTAKVQQSKDDGLFTFLKFSFYAGLYALLTPCVFPMIPITVSFFTKGKGKEGKTQYGGAVAYCLGIIGTFTALGLIVTAIFGATGISKLATNPWVNLAMAVLFIALAASLMGLFEIGMPSGLVNKLGAKSRAGGLLAPVLMGLTFSLTSFTCTVPFVGTILALAAKGDYLYPTLGMLAFSTAFALPFFLLALFPQFLAKLPKSGSWLATVKAFMGFLEVAAALKFLSNADLVWQFGILTRGVFLAIWTAVAIIGGLYLLGALRLATEEAGTRIGWLRRGFGVATLGAAVFCLAGIQGRPMGQFSSFLPPDPYPGQDAKASGPLKWETDYKSALAEAKASGKNVFIDFTGVTCTNCRFMEDNVFPKPRVIERMKHFVLVRLYTDRGTPSDNANATLQDQLAKVTTLPVYVMVGSDGMVVKVHQQQAPLGDENQFISALDAGLKSRVSSLP